MISLVGLLWRIFFSKYVFIRINMCHPLLKLLYTHSAVTINTTHEYYAPNFSF